MEIEVLISILIELGSPVIYLFENRKKNYLQTKKQMKKFNAIYVTSQVTCNMVFLLFLIAYAQNQTISIECIIFNGNGGNDSFNVYRHITIFHILR